jgi:hypothetical protein
VGARFDDASPRSAAAELRSGSRRRCSATRTACESPTVRFGEAVINASLPRPGVPSPAGDGAVSCRSGADLR